MNITCIFCCCCFCLFDFYFEKEVCLVFISFCEVLCYVEFDALPYKTSQLSIYEVTSQFICSMYIVLSCKTDMVLLTFIYIIVQV